MSIEAKKTHPDNSSFWLSFEHTESFAFWFLFWFLSRVNLAFYLAVSIIGFTTFLFQLPLCYIYEYCQKC